MSDEMRQTCKVCGRPDKFDFHVPDGIWNAVVPQEFRNRVVCLYCFDGFAKERDVDYSTSLKTLWFAGDKVSFEFQTVSAKPDSEWPPGPQAGGERHARRHRAGI